VLQSGIQIDDWHSTLIGSLDSRPLRERAGMTDNRETDSFSVVVAFLMKVSIIAFGRLRDSVRKPNLFELFGRGLSID
jgi:hypothetical protein